MFRLFTVAAAVAILLLGSQQLNADEKKKDDAPPKRRAIQLQLQPGAFQFAPPRRPRSIGRPDSILSLLQQEQVQQELKLDQDQVAKVNEQTQSLNKERANFLTEIRAAQGEERRKKIVELQQLNKKTEEATKKLRGILKPEQSQRLDQIALQLQGVRALSTKEIIDQLKITEEQQAKIRDVKAASRDKQQKLMQDVQNGNVEPAKLLARIQELTKQRDEDTLKVLTDAQRAQFDKMKGEKFELKPQVRLRAVPARPAQPRTVKPKNANT